MDCHEPRTFDETKRKVEAALRAKTATLTDIRERRIYACLWCGESVREGYRIVINSTRPRVLYDMYAIDTLCYRRIMHSCQEEDL